MAQSTVGMFQDLYRIDSERLKGWDYGSPAAYFVTVVTARRAHFFGEVRKGWMVLSELGQIAHDEWAKTPSLRADMNVSVDDFVVMPNHCHAIVIIGGGNATAVAANDRGRDALQRVATFGPQSKNLASIMRGYKSAVTTQARVLGLPFDWQARYHDHMIRDPEEHLRIAAYLQQNPQHWAWQRR